MKLYAIILSLAVLMYVAEQSTIPAAQCVSTTASCSKKMTCKERMQMQHKKDGKPKSCNPNNCVNCPLINTFTFPTLYASSLVEPPEHNFHTIQINTVSGVYWQVWQPPDVS